MMRGFKNNSLNNQTKTDVLSPIISHVAKCCIKMKQDCKTSLYFLFDDEDAISSRLIEIYLNENKLIPMIFLPQTPVNFNPLTDSFIGRIDILVGTEDLLKNHHAYYVIECKRIDGSKEMNKAYVTAGIFRFVEIPPKYPT